MIEVALCIVFLIWEKLVNWRRTLETVSTGYTPDTGVLTSVLLEKVYLLIGLGPLVDETIGP